MKRLHEAAINLAEANGKVWDNLEDDCRDPKNCFDGIPYKSHKRYWIELVKPQERAEP